jgi:hypothetical protein
MLQFALLIMMNIEDIWNWWAEVKIDGKIN